MLPNKVRENKLEGGFEEVLKEKKRGRNCKKSFAFFIFLESWS